MRALQLWVMLLATVYPVAGAENLTAREIAGARKIYVAKCAKCHKFYEPKDYSEADWHAWMRKMAKKSKLKEEQSTLLNRYLDAYRAGQLPGKPEDKR